MNTHARIKAVPAEPHPSFDLEEDICHLAREARAAEIIANDLIAIMRSVVTPGFSAEGIAALTRDSLELVEDFSGRVAKCSADLRQPYYEGVR